MPSIDLAFHCRWHYLLLLKDTAIKGNQVNPPKLNSFADVHAFHQSAFIKGCDKYVVVIQLHLHSQNKHKHLRLFFLCMLDFMKEGRHVGVIGVIQYSWED